MGTARRDPGLDIRLRLRVVADAERQIRDAATWWERNRPAAPGLFRRELTRALELITPQPGVGASARDPEFADVRRVLLVKIRYCLYYRVRDRDTVEILALWHTSRGSGPEL